MYKALSGEVQRRLHDTYQPLATAMMEIQPLRAHRRMRRGSTHSQNELCIHQQVAQMLTISESIFALAPIPSGGSQATPMSRNPLVSRDPTPSRSPSNPRQQQLRDGCLRCGSLDGVEGPTYNYIGEQPDSMW